MSDQFDIHRKPDRSKLGPDEIALLNALHGTGTVGEKLKKELEEEKGKAKYKIELRFGSGRSILPTSLNKGCIEIWESGRRLHGGGDEKMYWCGWTQDWIHSSQAKVCGRPITTNHFAHLHVVCPHCQQESFLSPGSKTEAMQLAQQQKKDTRPLERMPVVSGERFFRLPPPKLAKLLAKYWHELDGNADIYVKYHPTDIRCREVAEVKKPDHYDKARRKRADGLLVYPLARILKDISAGASVESRFLAMINA